MADTIQNIRCPFCGATEQKFFCSKDGFSLYRCAGCGHGSIRPLPPDMSGIYTQEYFTGADSGFGYVDYDRDKEPMRPLLTQSLVRAERLLGADDKTQKGNLLDVGAATGFFLGVARARGWNVRGVEISDFAAGIARGKGIDVTTGTLAGLEIPPRSFDLITFWDVIEHVRDPLEELRRATELLVPGGVLLMTTPDWDSRYARLLGKRWHAIVPPEHIHYFTRASMRLLLDKAGLQEIDIYGPAKSFTLAYVFQTLSRWQGPFVWGRAARFLKRHPTLGELHLPIPLRDNILVLARKI